MSKPEVIFVSVWKGDHNSYGITLLGNGPCIVSDVSLDGPAAKAGVQPGLVVLEVAGKNVINKNHKEVRQMIHAADVHLPVQFKFATLDSACLFFGSELKSMYESCYSKKRRSSGNNIKLQSPKKSLLGGKTEDDAKENQAQLPSTPPKEENKLTPVKSRPAVNNYQKSRELARWMRRSNEGSPSLQNSPALASPAHPSSSTEFYCLYYSNLVDLLGSMEEGVFQKNVQYLKSYKVPAQFWCRLVINVKTQSLSIYRPEGKYAVYTGKNLRQVFVHPDGLFVGLSTVRSSKVVTTSPGDAALAPASMDVYSCHILFVEGAVHFDQKQQAQVLTQLVGPDKTVARLSNAHQSFPLDASTLVEALTGLSDSLASVAKPVAVKKTVSTDLDGFAGDVSTVSGEGTPDVTVELNNANVLRHSMRKYGPYAGNLRRNSISSDSLHAPALASLPFRPGAVERRPFTHRYSCIGMTYNIPQSVEEGRGSLCDSMPSVAVKELSSVQESPVRDVVSSLELTHPSDDDFRPQAFSTPGATSQQSTSSRSGKITLMEVLQHPKGLNIFQAFLASEHSQENVKFWLAGQEYRSLNNTKEMRMMAKKMYGRFIAVSGQEAVNVDGAVRSAIADGLEQADIRLFDTACKQVFDLMKSDSFPRFVTSSYYLQLRQVLDGADLFQLDFNQSMPCLLRMNSVSSAKSADISSPRRQSALFAWMKKKSDSRLSGGASARRSLPGHGQAKNNSLVITTSNRLAVDESTDSGVELSSHNPLKKLLDRGRKSLSARVKPSKRESVITFLSESEVCKKNEPKNASSPVSFEFRRPLTPPPSRNQEVQLRRAAQVRSVGRDQKRLSLQAAQRSSVKSQPRTATEAATEWTFSHSSSLNLDQTPQPVSSLTRAHPVAVHRRTEIAPRLVDF